eukprot:NODE_54_length_30443_cov_1.442954.p4 type:complete len:567 gc:universal NODE_54_length_30443_cov_1.442954:5185-6885(+)
MYFQEGEFVTVKGTTCNILSLESGTLQDDANAFVYKIKMQNEDFALKSWVQTEKAIYNEIHSLERTGGHPNIVEHVKSECKQNEKSLNGLIVMEFLAGGTLKDLIASRSNLIENANSTMNPGAYLKDEQSMQIFTAITSAVAHLQALEPPLYHWDIQPSNIMMVVSSGQIPQNDFTCVKLIDFGNSFSTPINPTSLSSKEIDEKIEVFKNTTNLSYRAPEMVAMNAVIDGQADVWALGCLLYSLLYLEDYYKTISDITSGKFIIKTTPKYPPYFEILLSKIILKEPDRRMKAFQVLSQCREFFIGALPSWITRKYKPQAYNSPNSITLSTSVSKSSIPASTNEAPGIEYFDEHILDIAGFSDLNNPMRQINFQFPDEICVSVDKVVFTIPLSIEDQSASKHNVSASIAIYHPAEHLLVTCFNNSLDVFDVAKKQRIQSQALPTSEVIFMSWLHDTTISLITKEAVYHMEIAGENEIIEEMCGIFDSVTENNIAYYDIDSNENPQWLLIVAPNTKEPPKGQIQLHSMEKSGSQIIPGETARLYKPNGKLDFLKLLLVNRGQNHTYVP